MMLIIIIKLRQENDYEKQFEKDVCKCPGNKRFKFWPLPDSITYAQKLQFFPTAVD